MEKFGLIGRRLEHSFSPRIHALLGDYEYGLYPLEPERLDEFFRENDLRGFNVTIPYKLDAVPYCSELSARAKSIGCVNTVLRRPDGTYYGDNTDYYGFSVMLGEDRHLPAGEKALVLGSGGASKTAAAVLRDAGADPVVIVSRTGSDNYGSISKHYDTRLIVNTTPVGMYPDNGSSLLELERFERCRLVLDVIYNPAKTKLLLDAQRLNIPCRGGLRMLVAQAKAAAELFLGRSVPDSLIAQITGVLSRQTKNIALIGMPGSGKTTVGKYLAGLTGRRLVDTDALIEQAEGTDISSIFASKGEKYFRTQETNVLREVSKESGIIIAAGGGVVTVPENRDLLMQNSTVVLINADIGSLTTKGRPLSQSLGTEELYRRRQPLYEAWSDCSFFNDSSYDTALKIKEELGL